MSKHLKRVLALLLVLVMVLGLLPTVAFAEDASTPSQLEDGRGLGKKVPDRYVSTRNITPKTSTPKTALPASYNSNTLGYITPIRNQGSYGTCWAHGAIASCEAYMIKHGVKVGTGSAATTSLNLSELHLAWFGYTDAYDKLGLLAGDKTTALDDYRDLGGFGEIPTYTLMRWEGLASESTSALAYSKASSSANGLNSSYAYNYNVAHVQDCVWIPTSNRTAVKEAIMEYGAGTFGYYADDNYEQNDGSYYYPSNKSSNHDVTVVGWDDNYSKSKFSPQPSGNGAWIIKNSWGTSYGTNGYYYISYYDVPSNNDTCYFYKVEDVDNYDNNYQYDGTTNFNNYMQLKRNGSVANVFTANGTETLEAVAFCNWDAGMSYKCDIYKNPTGNNPTSGTLVSTKSGTFEYAGYHTVELDTTVSLSAGDKFSVVFTNTGSSTIDIGLDQTGSSSGWVSWTHSSPSGASFYTNSGSWTDYSGTANLRIKAYTKNGQVVQEPCTITLKAGTSTWQTVNTTTNTSATLPSYTGTVPSGYTFAGWTASTISGTTQSAPTLYTGSYSTGSATAITLYACFSKSESSGGSSTGYRLMTSAPVAGDQIIIAGKNGSSYYAFKTDASTTGVAITVSNNLVTSDPTGLVWEVDSGNYGSTSGLTLSDSGYYLHINSSALKVVSNDKNNGIFGFTSTGNNTYSVDGLVNSKYLGFSGTSFSASGSATGLYLFKYGTGSGSTTTYTTTITTCSHTYAESDRLDATCTDEGTIEYTCSKCGDRYYDDIPALGHDYGAWTSNNNGKHSKTCRRAGCGDVVTENCSYTSSTSGATTTFTCSVCNYSYSTVLNTYTVSYNVLGSVVNTASCVEGQSVTLPAAATAVEGYTFAGWVNTAIATETETAPTVLTGSYQPTANVTLYALYTRTEAGEGGAAPTSGYAVGNTGSYVIAADVNGTWYALPNAPTLSSGKIDGEVITVSDNNSIKYVTTANAEGYVWTVAKSGSYYTISDGSKSIYHSNGGASGTNLTYGTSANYPWDIYTSSGNILLAGAVKSTSTTGSRGMLVRIDGDTPLFGGYSLSNVSNTDYTNVILLPVSGGSASTTYYTTNPTSVTPPHVHDYDASGVCSCGDKLISIDSASLRLDEDIDVIYNVTVPEGATATMTFTMNSEITTVNDDGSHSFTFEGVNPQCMGDNISATLSVNYGGKTYSCTKANYSVKAYCTDMLAKSGTSASLKKLLSDTLAYGAAAQTYMGYKTSSLVTSGVTGTSYSTFTSLSGLNATFTGTAAESPCWIGASLDLSNNVAMVFRFASPNKTGLSVKVTYNGKTTTFSGTSITAVSGMSGVYEVKLTGIKATDFDETVSASFYKSSAQVGNMVSYSVNTYICAKQADNDANLAALVKALYNYGASAKAYNAA